MNLQGMKEYKSEQTRRRIIQKGRNTEKCFSVKQKKLGEAGSVKTWPAPAFCIPERPTWTIHELPCTALSQARSGSLIAETPKHSLTLVLQHQRYSVPFCLASCPQLLTDRPAHDWARPSSGRLNCPAQHHFPLRNGCASTETVARAPRQWVVATRHEMP